MPTNTKKAYPAQYMKHLFIFIITLLTYSQILAQGCSDAGFCSLGDLKNHNEPDSSRKSISVGLNYGLGEEGTSTINSYLEYTQMLGNRFGFQSKITATYAAGFLGSNFTIGDLFATLTYKPAISGKNDLNFIGGLKIPLTDGNAKNNNNLPLPLDYQATIGTYDAIAGLNYIVDKKWEFDAAVQIPLIQQNNSTFFPELYTDPRIIKFAPTNNFKRQSDVLARLGYYIQIPHSGITLKPSLLAIYHVGDDTYLNQSGNRTTISGSQGLTLNGTVVATKKFNSGNRFEVVFGTPFIVRQVRPDGLTRGLVVNFQYTIAL